MKKQRKHYSAEEKVAILRRHLLDKEPISKLCDELGSQPTVFYRWQKEFFENGAAAFQQKRPLNHSADQERIAYLEKKIQTKDEVLAERGVHSPLDRLRKAVSTVRAAGLSGLTGRPKTGRKVVGHGRSR